MLFMLPCRTQVDATKWGEELSFDVRYEIIRERCGLTSFC